MFIMVWTFVSYILGTLCVVGFTGVVGEAVNANAVANAANAANAATAANAVANAASAATAATAANAATVATFATSGDTAGVATANTELDLVKVRRKPRRAKGYYIRGMVNGQPKYVYYGTESPFDE